MDSKIILKCLLKFIFQKGDVHILLNQKENYYEVETLGLFKFFEI